MYLRREGRRVNGLQRFNGCEHGKVACLFCGFRVYYTRKELSPRDKFDLEKSLARISHRKAWHHTNSATATLRRLAKFLRWVLMRSISCKVSAVR